VGGLYSETVLFAGVTSPPLFGVKVLDFIDLIAEPGVSRKGHAGALRADPSLRVAVPSHRPATVAEGGVVPMLFDIEKKGDA